MAKTAARSFYEDPNLQETLVAFQEERWSDGLSQLDALMEQYPFEQDLRRLRQEVLVRARVDEYELEENERDNRRRFRQTAARLAVAAAFILAIVLGSTTFAGAIQRQFANAQSLVQQEYSRIELSIKLRDAQNLIEAGRPEEALVVLEEIRAVDPNYEGLDEYLALANGQLSLEGRYQAARTLIEAGEWESALAALEEIDAESPNYRDVALLIEEARVSITLEETLTAADEAFDAENWGQAVELYEQVRIANANFEEQRVESQLFASYINAATAVLDDPQAELEELGIADELFRRALALRPRNQEVLSAWNSARGAVRTRLVNRYLDEAETALVNNEDSEEALQTAGAFLDKARALEPGNAAIAVQADNVNRYLQALSDFRASLWNQVILNLEHIYALDADYASGTARQALYDVYIIRGDGYLSSGEFELALDDYRRAVVLAQDMAEGGVLSTFEAQLKVAFTLGRLFDYEGAVIMYQTAVDTSGRQSDENADPSFIDALDAADALALNGEYRQAYIRFRDIFSQDQLVYTDYVVHVVGEGDYLSKLANQYNSTIQAIAIANDLPDPNWVIIGQELIIPVFPDEG